MRITWRAGVGQMQTDNCRTQSSHSDLLCDAGQLLLFVGVYSGRKPLLLAGKIGRKRLYADSLPGCYPAAPGVIQQNCCPNL